MQNAKISITEEYLIVVWRLTQRKTLTDYPYYPR